MDQTSDMRQAIHQKHEDALTPLGIQLRDTFAAAALTGLLAGADYEYPAEGFAKQAYQLADAMLAARLKKA